MDFGTPGYPDLHWLQSLLRFISVELLMLPNGLVKSWLIGKDPDSGRDWGQEKKGTTEDEMAGWHHWLDGRESEWTPGVGDGQGGLVCCNSWGRKESDMTERLNWTELNCLILWGPLLLLPSIFPSPGFPMSWYFTSSGQSIGASASAPVLSINIGSFTKCGSFTKWKKMNCELI